MKIIINFYLENVENLIYKLNIVKFSKEITIYKKFKQVIEKV